LPNPQKRERKPHSGKKGIAINPVTILIAGPPRATHFRHRGGNLSQSSSE